MKLMNDAGSIGKLLGISSAPSCATRPILSKALLARCAPELARQYIALLESKNGFFAFESALHVFPAGCGEDDYDVDTWNDEAGWVSAYGDVVKGHLFFSEDIFGEQFSINGDCVFRFDPETGGFTAMANSLNEWAQNILKDYEAETGYGLAHEWQVKHGPLQTNKRLLPKTPFILGGAYTIANLSASDAMEGMRLRADIWRQIKDLPAGSQITLRVTH